LLNPGSKILDPGYNMKDPYKPPGSATLITIESQRSFLCRTDEQLLWQRDTPASFLFVNKRKRWHTYIFSDSFGYL
jgi:hypothetical protein